MSTARDTVTVRVPGSTSNCGAGFDTLGLALSVYNRVTLTRAAGTVPQPERPADGRAQEMVAETAVLFFRTAGLAPAGFRYRIEGDPSTATEAGATISVVEPSRATFRSVP